MVLVWALLGCSGTPVADDTASDPPFTVVTFNVGTSEGMPHDAPPDDGYTSDHAASSDTWYGDGLAWVPAVQATTRFFAETQPDIVVFQEVFHPDHCATIPADHHTDFICEAWSAGDPTVAQLVLGDGYQVACHPGHDDKCAAVRTEFGTFRGCQGDLCIEGLDGSSVEGCGSGARVARGVIGRTDGTELVLVNVHGSSGLSDDDEACRTAQVDQIFVDLDGQPAANGTSNLIMGDLNTDPGRWAEIDPSAARWAELVGSGGGFHFISDVGPDAPPSYNGIANIDHVMSDSLTGECRVWGLSEGTIPVLDATYFDHKPIVCEVQ